MANPSTLVERLTRWGGGVAGALPSWVSFRGILSRRSYLVGLLLVAVPAMVLLSLDLVRPLQIVLALPLVFATASLVVRRLRDAGRSPTLVLLGLLPLIGWVMLAWFTSAQSGPSKPARASRFIPGLAAFVALLLVGATAMALPDTPGDTRLTDTSISAESPSLLGDEGVGRTPGDNGLPESAEEQAGQDTAVSEVETPGEPTEQDADPPAPEVPAEEPVTAEPPSSSQATGLAGLVAQLVVEEEFGSGYDRGLFRHWIDASGNGCDTRREVLIAESTTPVSVGARCSLTGGTWYSAFDGATTTDPSTFDVDHFVPLKEAWDSGAHAWDSGTRQRFANDLEFAGSLIAVSASSNRSKGARDPAEWLPPNAGYRCAYLITWVEVKLRWKLSADPREVAAIRSAGASC